MSSTLNAQTYAGTVTGHKFSRLADFAPKLTIYSKLFYILDEHQSISPSRGQVFRSMPKYLPTQFLPNYVIAQLI